MKKVKKQYSQLSAPLPSFVAPPARTTRSSKDLLSTYRDSPHIRAIVGAIANGVAFAQYRLVDQTGASVQNGVAYDVLRREHAGLTIASLLHAVQVNIECVGVADMLLLRDVNNLPAQIILLPYHCVKSRPSAKSQFYEIQSGTEKKQYHKDDIFSFKNPDPRDPYNYTTGVVQSLVDELDADELAATHIKSFLANHAMPSMMVGISGDGPISEEELEIAKQRMQQLNHGPDRRGRIHFHNGELSPVRLDDNFTDLGLVQIREYQAKIIRETFGVPPEIIGHTETSNLSLSEQSQIIFARQVLAPRIKLIIDTLNTFVFSKFDAPAQKVRLEYSQPQQLSTDNLVLAMQSNPSAYSINELRSVTGRDPIEEVNNTTLDGRSIVKEIKPIDTGINGAQAQAIMLALERVALGSLSENAAVELMQLIAPTANIDSLKRMAQGALTPAVVAEQEQVQEVLPTEKSYAQKKYITSSALDAIFSTHKSVRATWGAVKETIYRATEDGYAEEEIEEVNSINPIELARGIEKKYKAKYRGKSAMINEYSRQLVDEQLQEAQLLGEGAQKVIKRLRDVLDPSSEVARHRLEAIARTETQSAVNESRQDLFAELQKAGLRTHKRWVATDDDRTRDEHDDLDDDVVAIDEPFIIDGNQAMAPNGFGVAELDINCRCTTVSLQLDDNTDENSYRGDAIYKSDKYQKMIAQYKRTAAKSEMNIYSAYAELFEDQLNKIIKDIKHD
jgi:HK97 family phage portal protein